MLLNAHNQCPGKDSKSKKEKLLPGRPGHGPEFASVPSEAAVPEADGIAQAHLLHLMPPLEG